MNAPASAMDAHVMAKRDAIVYNLHRYGEQDASGNRACQNIGCSVRVRDAFRWWQEAPRTRWRFWANAPIPACQGEQP